MLIKKNKYIVIVFVVLLIFLGTMFLLSKKNEKTISIVLKSNPSTGYSWGYEISDESVLKFVSEEYRANENNGIHVVGASEESKFVFKGVGRGKVKITFEYKRSNSKPILIYTYEYEVNDKDIKLIKEDKKENK